MAVPSAPPVVEGYQFFDFYEAANQVGGDFYDYIVLKDGRVAVVLADVSGKGTAAALLMSATRAMLRSLAENACTPSEVLTKLNRLLVEDFLFGTEQPSLGIEA